MKKKGTKKSGGKKAEAAPAPTIRIEQENQDRAIDHIRLRNVEGLNKMIEEDPENVEFLNKYHTKAGKTCLMIASEEGYLEAVQALLDVQANVALRDKGASGMNAFHMAARYGHEKVLECLIHSYADINKLTKDKDETALMLAIRWGHISTALYLISVEIVLDAVNNAQESALSIALKYEWFEVAKSLANKSCDINFKGMNGNSPLIRSAFDGRDNTMSFILSNGGDVHLKNDNGETALLVAAKLGRTVIVEGLINCKADVNATDTLARTGLMYATMTSKLDIVKILLAAKANVNQLDMYGFSAFTYACVNKQGLDMCMLFLEAGAYIDAMDKNYNTALMHACRKGHEDIALRLVAKGADYSLTNIDNIAPIDSIPEESQPPPVAEEAQVQEGNKEGEGRGEGAQVQVVNNEGKDGQVKEVVVVNKFKERMRAAMEQYPLSSRPLNYMKKNPGVKDKPKWIGRLDSKGYLD